jgi:ubiquinone/menaquinone biosynthesis C-methylase UbiE
MNPEQFYDKKALDALRGQTDNKYKTVLWFHSLLKSKWIRFMRSADRKVLSLCCGNGQDLKKWEKYRSRHITFVDISQKCIDELKNRSKRSRLKCEILCADCLTPSFFPTLGRTFDIVTCMFALHYCNVKPKVFLEGLAPVVTEGGKFLAILPVKETIDNAPDSKYYEIDVKNSTDELTTYRFKMGERVDAVETAYTTESYKSPYFERIFSRTFYDSKCKPKGRSLGKAVELTKLYHVFMFMRNSRPVEKPRSTKRRKTCK